MRLAMMANPSHLEAIDPVIVGRVRAEQVERGDSKRMYSRGYSRIPNLAIDDNSVRRINGFLQTVKNRWLYWFTATPPLRVKVSFMKRCISLICQNIRRVAFYMS